jgi:hypothetical protein
MTRNKIGQKIAHSYEKRPTDFIIFSPFQAPVVLSARCTSLAACSPFLRQLQRPSSCSYLLDLLGSASSCSRLLPGEGPPFFFRRTPPFIC